MNTAIKPPKKPRSTPAAPPVPAPASPSPGASVSIADAIDPSAAGQRLGEVLKVPAGASPETLRSLFDRAKHEMATNNSLMRRAKPLLLRRNQALRAFCTRLQLELREAESPASAPVTSE